MDKLINLTKTIAIAALFLVSLSSCDKKHDNDKYLKQIKELKQEIAELKKQLGTINDRKPDNIIDLEFASQLYHNYDTTRIKWTNDYIQKHSGQEKFKATRSLYYNLDDLYNYLAYIKRISKEANVKPSGLRFYFGAYAKDYKRDDGDTAYAHRQTIFITPTIAKQVGKETMHLGYTLSNDFKVELLKDKIGTDSRGKSANGSSMQKASLFNFNSSTNMFGENSTIANEIAGSPPKGDEQ
ncbi:hypothetical protein IWQ47_004268 [Aquimarina sp. EL_43]|uniref:hypothetical protein n=1 Tax=unclassified Aquimarina TaxID=2627091 RepID=UPI0018C9ACD2|nr:MULTISPECIES: hypothetical protein [unclassified Aquimarina]MBG6133032.1 hypothetical protein [Aquimarina sp. EL_35]MBG6152343.1 hypothetical protein [Aquimarina sp. EL_32]MBG6171181.1 hypothetical protein [Aquimarina sp. EL_43]